MQRASDRFEVESRLRAFEGDDLAAPGALGIPERSPFRCLSFCSSVLLLLGCAAGCSSSEEAAAPPAVGQDAAVDQEAGLSEEASLPGEDAASEEAAPPQEAGPSQEVCNFVDDDGDGDVDEGFAWVASPPRTLFGTKLLASLMGAIPLPDGRVAITGADNLGEPPGDRQFIATLAADGTLLEGPVFLDMGGAAGGGTISQLPSGDLVVVFGAQDYAGCTQGCATHVVTLDPSDLSVKSDVPLDVAKSAVMPAGLFCSAAACVTAVSYGTGEPPGLVWFDPVTGLISSAMEWPGGSAGSFAGGAALAWVNSSTTGDPPLSTIRFGVRSLDGLHELVAPMTIVEDAIAALPNPDAVAMLQDSALLSYKVEPDAGAINQLMTIGLDGGILLGPKEVPGTISSLRIAAVIDGSPIMSAITSKVDFDLHRLRPSLERLDAPNNPLHFDQSAFTYAVSPIPNGMLIVRGTFDGRSVDSTRIECFGGNP